MGFQQAECSLWRNREWWVIVHPPHRATQCSKDSALPLQLAWSGLQGRQLGSPVWGPSWDPEIKNFVSWGQLQVLSRLREPVPETDCSSARGPHSPHTQCLSLREDSHGADPLPTGSCSTKGLGSLRNVRRRGEDLTAEEVRLCG